MDSLTYSLAVLAVASLVVVVLTTVHDIRHRPPDQRPIDAWASPSPLRGVSLGAMILFTILAGLR